jgi:hypothetical protein
MKKKNTLPSLLAGNGPEGDKWLPAEELAHCTALDLWIAQKTTSNLLSYVTSNIPASSFSSTGF